MDLKTIRNELGMLSEIFDGWNVPGDITPLERDLALEKLRRIYESVRFAEPVLAAQDVEPEIPVSINLDVVLSPGSGEVFSASADTGFQPSAASIPSEKAEPEHVSGLPSAAVSGPKMDPVAVSEPETDPVAVSGPKTDPVSESVSVSDPASELAPRSASESTPTPRQDVPPQPVPINLFGAEDESERHRRKQRVIMSLYHNEELAPAPKPAIQSFSAPVPEPASQSVSTPASQLVPEPASQPVSTPASQRLSGSAADQSAETEDEVNFEEFSVETVPSAETLDRDAATPADETLELQSAPTPDAGASAAPGTVLGDVINHDMQTLSDTFAPRRDTLSETAHRAHISDLRAAIGINDRFLLVRDLFQGDTEACDTALDALNAFDDLDDCMIYIAENYVWNPNSDGVKLLTELLERKHA